jgi:pyrrolidone-carboxylate peptidase
MNRVLTYLFLSSICAPLWAKESVLISSFDPFGGSSYNNSNRIAREVKTHLSETVDVMTCVLPTSYQRAIPALEKCLSEMRNPPALIVSLGEGPCSVKWETRAHNRDHDRGPDNDGVSRRRQTIIADAPQELGLRLNYPAMWCSLTHEEKKLTQVSVDPENFVCNNTAYRFSHNNPEQLYGFVHVPRTSCEKKTPGITARSSELVAKMIRQQLAVSATDNSRLDLPRFGNFTRLATTRIEVKAMQRDTAEICEEEFLKRWLKAF